MFGLTEITGKYRISNDTIYFSLVDLGRNEDDYYNFAVIAKDSNNRLGEIVRYKDLSDSEGNSLRIKKNKLPK